LVQQGAELSYLILHDPEFRRVRRDDLIETGKRIRLKHDVALFARALDNLADDYKFSFYVISAAPQEIIQSALEGIVPSEHIFGTRFRYNDSSGEVESIIRASAGWGKITVLEEIRAMLGISHDHIIYMGDGSSDLPVMMHVNHHDGLTIAVSEAKYITKVARRTVLSDNTMSVLVPVLEELLRWATPVMHFRRTVTRDVEIRGQHIPAGDWVLLHYLSANRDEEVFDRADEFDVTRPDAGHAAFGGGGVHFCLGAQLARLELRVLLEELYPNVPGLTVTGPPDRLRSSFFHGIKRLPCSTG